MVHPIPSPTLPLKGREKCSSPLKRRERCSSPLKRRERCSSPFKGRERCSSPFKGRERCSSPFKGEAGRGMGNVFHVKARPPSPPSRGVLIGSLRSIITGHSE
ncbi:MAG: hypothetical protein Q8O31_04245 [Rhodocyclaceae bacterium]|nr:hypothetical protein [Rhodocyclaceae bacterium]